jgi:hypothetical protein
VIWGDHGNDNGAAKCCARQTNHSAYLAEPRALLRRIAGTPSEIALGRGRSFWRSPMPSDLQRFAPSAHPEVGGQKPWRYGRRDRRGA